MTTEDGYILALYRIPSGRKSKDGKSRSSKSKKIPVMLQHGITVDYRNWLGLGPDHGLRKKLIIDIFQGGKYK